MYREQWGCGACARLRVARSGGRPVGQGRRARLRRVGRLGLDHRIAEVGELRVHARLPGPQEYYVGDDPQVRPRYRRHRPAADGLGRLRLDLGGRGALAGNYAGATGEATVAVGLGANVLVGGSNRTVALQPLSVTGQVGLNSRSASPSCSLRPAR